MNQFKSHERIHGRVNHWSTYITTKLITTKGPGQMPVVVHLNQKRRNSGENGAENSGTDDALHHIHRAI